jgi:hypothetical protein
MSAIIFEEAYMRSKEPRQYQPIMLGDSTNAPRFSFTFGGQTIHHHYGTAKP